MFGPPTIYCPDVQCLQLCPKSADVGILSPEMLHAAIFVSVWAGCIVSKIPYDEDRSLNIGTLCQKDNTYE